MAKPGQAVATHAKRGNFGGECYSPTPNCGYSRATPRGASHPSIEGCDANLLSPQEEGLFKADAVNEEDPEFDRATQV